jgi:hypothetical protein
MDTTSASTGSRAAAKVLVHLSGMYLNTRLFFLLEV